MIGPIIRGALAVSRSPSAKNFTREGIKMAAKRAKGIWGVTAKEIAELKKMGIKVNEYWRSGPNPGQR